MTARTYIILVNWNGWRDTIDCLESVLRLRDAEFRVVVCDNASSDDSLTHLVAWAEGREYSVHTPPATLRKLTEPPQPKPIEYAVLDRERAERGEIEGDPPLVLINTEGNLGFAGGNNVGMRYALARGDASWIWLLNNDTVVEADCLAQMLRRLEQADGPATCGSRVLFYDDPTVVQALGGSRFNRWSGISSRSLGRYQSNETPVDPTAIEAQLSYIVGCTWLLPVDYLHTVGLMDESYFLYYEEIDWVLRAKGRYALCYADKARVYHREGSSIGSPTGERPASSLSDFYIFRNKLRLTRTHFPYALPSVMLATLLQALRRVLRGEPQRAWRIVRVLAGQRRPD